MPDSKKYLHPEAIKRISRLEVRARHIVEGFLSGMHRSPYFGQSVEFLQHREYVIGDDLRHVDWKVWARQDRLYIKQFEEETNLRCNLLVDISKSMTYGNGTFNKFEYAATLAATLGYLILHQQDSVGCVTFDDRVRGFVNRQGRDEHAERQEELGEVDLRQVGEVYMPDRLTADTGRRSRLSAWRNKRARRPRSSYPPPPSAPRASHA